MNYQVLTYQGIKITLEDDFDLKSFIEATLNNNEINSVAFGKVSSLKNNIRFIYPVYAEGEERPGEKLTIFTNGSNEALIAYAENYSSGNVTDQFNDRTKPFILIGDTGIHRNEYSLVMATPETPAAE